MPDLNAITPDTSPAFDLLTEHPTGEDYGVYLEKISKFYNLLISTGIEVQQVIDKGEGFFINTNDGRYASRFVIWAAGEYQYPKTNAFRGDHHCMHYAEVDSFTDFTGRQLVVIGGYESGFDAALNLAERGKKVTLIDSANYLELINSDSSYSLSPFTRDRIRQHLDDIDYVEESRVRDVRLQDGKFIVSTYHGDVFLSDDTPINCTGFDTSLKLVSDLFDFEQDFPLLTPVDESRKTKHLFLVGPQVKHENALFCFIYKYRQRFAVVAEEIAQRLEVTHDKIENVLKDYKNNNFYLTDLSCCDDECIC